MTVQLLLQDGTYMIAKSFGATGTAIGELVFNTGMTGYQEILTDPSYAGQIVTMTYPLVGNYGINGYDKESDKPKVSGFIVKEYAKEPSHWQSNESIDDYLIRHDIMGVYDIDTRMLTKRIRSHGVMSVLMTTDMSMSREAMQAQLRAYHFPKDIVKRVSTEMPYTMTAFSEAEINHRHIGIIDLGVKNGIMKQLNKRGCHVTIHPYNVTADTILKEDYDAILFSNGPGDPKDCTEAITLAKVLQGQLPLFGICLGHQILALSMGADTYKLKFGHRGSNHPVIESETGKVYMTAQNHGYAVDVATVPAFAKVTHTNVNDQTVEGLRWDEKHIASIQFHPEEGPGPTDATVIFKQWIDTLGRK